MGSSTENSYTILGLPDQAPIGDVKKAFQHIKNEVARNGDWKRLKEASAAYDILMELNDPGDGGISIPAAPDDAGSRPIIDLFLPAQTNVNVLFFAGRCVVFLLILVAGVRLMVNLPSSEMAGHSFFHNISIPFHEAGHILFSFFGDFIRTLGGSIMQVLVPIVCLVAFMKKEDVFAASFALWWTGQNFIDMAPYINDARAQSLMLLGGVTGEDVPGYHDWNNILRTVRPLKTRPCTRQSFPFPRLPTHDRRLSLVQHRFVHAIQELGETEKNVRCKTREVKAPIKFSGLFFSRLTSYDLRLATDLL
jgi:hypothetical protein